jgi:type IV secretory pathway component VirB8
MDNYLWYKRMKKRERREKIHAIVMVTLIGLTILAGAYIMCLPLIQTVKEIIRPAYSDTLIYKFLELISIYG